MIIFLMEMSGIIYTVFSQSLSIFLTAFVYVKKYSIFIHLFSLDSEGLPIGKLDMRQRLIIALGAAKGRLNISISFTDCNGHEIMKLFDPTNFASSIRT